MLGLSLFAIHVVQVDNSAIYGHFEIIDTIRCLIVEGFVGFEIFRITRFENLETLYRTNH